ncbi:hypothetical protein V8E55_006625 [Tylopilus felleus]
MNRLTTLEANHTQYARYVEEQTAGVREVPRTLNRKAQMYHRTVHEWERQTLRFELGLGELLSGVHYLTDEVVLEKRLGITQLYLLLGVLLFIGLTRGTTPAQHPPPTMDRSTREWGVRSLNFGGSTDGWNPLRRQNLRIPGPNYTLSYQQPLKAFELPVTWMATSSRKRAHASTVFRTLTKSRPPTKSRPLTLGDVASVSSSSSALSPSHVKARHRLPDELRRPLMPMAVVRNSLEEGADADTWVDTDVDKDDVVVVSERAVVLNSPERDAFT